MFGSYEMIDDVGSGSVASSVAEPLLAYIAHDHTRWIMNGTVLTGKYWQLLCNKIKLISDS